MIDTQAIRKKILDLALRGKLTEQRPEDGTAGELYRQIEYQRNNKQSKTSQAALIPDSEIPYTIPSNWMWLRLQDIGIYSGGKTPSMANKEYWSDGSVPWITSKDMKQKYLSTSEMLISNAATQELTIYPEKTVLFVVRSGILRRSFPVAILTQKGTINQDLKALRLYEPAMCEYVYYLLKGFETTILFQYAKDGTTVNNIVFDALLTMPIPIPPLAEQNRIVEKVQTIFALLDSIDTLQSQYQDNLATLKSKIIDAGIQGKLTEQLPEDGTAEELYQRIQQEKLALEKAGKVKKSKPLPPISEEEKPFDIPENWKWYRLSDISSTNIGLTYHPEDVCDDGTIVIRSSNIVNSKMDYSDIVKVKCEIRKNQYLNNNDIVICARNGSKALVGKCAIYEGESDKIAFGAFMAVLRTSYYKYVFYYLLTNTFRRYFQSDDSKQISQVTQNILKEAIIPLPPLAEQKRIVAKLEELLPLCEG